MYSFPFIEKKKCNTGFGIVVIQPVFVVLAYIVRQRGISSLPISVPLMPTKKKEDQINYAQQVSLWRISLNSYQ